MSELTDGFCKKNRVIINRWSFPKCWRPANATAIGKGAPSSDGEYFRPMSVTPILSVY